MISFEVLNLIELAIEQTIKEQRRLLRHKLAKSRKELLPILEAMTDMSGELNLWRRGASSRKDPLPNIIKIARKIETKSRALSEKLWVPIGVNLVPIVELISSTAAELRKDKTFTRRLRAQLNSVRLGLLEQIAGARLFENNSDLGEQVERILLEYLRRNLGGSVRVLRGGHIYGKDNARSAQMDLIITPAEALPFCPADVEEGRYNVMADQVIAAISVKSTLDKEALREAWKEIQSIPVETDVSKAHPKLSGEAWPLCYIIGAHGEDMETLKTELSKLMTGTVPHRLQMLLVLEKGYIVPGNASWPTSFKSHGPTTLHIETGEHACVGLGWLNAGIAGRCGVLQNRSVQWVQNMAQQIRNCELKPVHQPHEGRRTNLGTGIFGSLRWGHRGWNIHDNLFVETLEINGIPIPDRWFKREWPNKVEDFCAMEEWTNAKDKTNHRHRVIIFHITTGHEIPIPSEITLTSTRDFQTQHLPLIKLAAKKISGIE
jgi:hypothetical protein